MLDSDLRDFFQPNSFCNSVIHFVKEEFAEDHHESQLQNQKALAQPKSTELTKYTHINLQTCKKEKKHHILHNKKAESTQKFSIKIIILAFQSILY